MGFAKRRAEELALRRFGEVGDQAVCLECILDADLRAEARPYLAESSCTFCLRSTENEEEPISVPFEDFVTIIMRGVNFLYTAAGDAGVPRDEGDWVGATLDTHDVIDEVCSYVVEHSVLEAIQHAVHPEDWIEGSHYAESTPDRTLEWAWERLCEKVKYSSRFVFMAEAEESSGHPDDMTTKEWLYALDEMITRNDALRQIPEGTTYWRGRLVNDLSSGRGMRDATKLGPPPRDLASNNRMSPAGISFFYGSEDVPTVVAEIGAHAIRKYAVVGEFECTRQLTVLDLVNLPEPPSIFSWRINSREYYERRFLLAFAADLAKPIELDGREHIDYVPTQVVTEFLRKIPVVGIDGILFRSAQNGGVNCVLFFGPGECVTDRAPARTAFGPSQDPGLSLKSETVQSVRIVASVYPPGLRPL